MSRPPIKSSSLPNHPRIMVFVFSSSTIKLVKFIFFFFSWWMGIMEDDTLILQVGTALDTLYRCVVFGFYITL